MTFDLPLPPNLGNARKAWRELRRLHDRYNDDCDLLAAAGLVPRAPGSAASAVRVRARLRVHNLMDWDNAFARLKWALDWLVTRGYLADDSPRVIQECPEVDQVIDRSRPGLEIVLEELWV